MDYYLEALEQRMALGGPHGTVIHIYKRQRQVWLSSMQEAPAADDGDEGDAAPGKGARGRRPRGRPKKAERGGGGGAPQTFSVAQLAAAATSGARRLLPPAAVLPAAARESRRTVPERAAAWLKALPANVRAVVTTRRKGDARYGARKSPPLGLFSLPNVLGTGGPAVGPTIPHPPGQP
jgi:hypothetical protein